MKGQNEDKSQASISDVSEEKLDNIVSVIVLKMILCFYVTISNRDVSYNVHRLMIFSILGCMKNLRRK